MLKTDEEVANHLKEIEPSAWQLLFRHYQFCRSMNMTITEAVHETMYMRKTFLPTVSNRNWD